MSRVGDVQGKELLALLLSLERLVAHRKGAAAGVSRAVAERLQHTQNTIAALRQQVSDTPDGANWGEQVARLKEQLPPKEASYLQKFLDHLGSEPGEDG